MKKIVKLAIILLFACGPVLLIAQNPPHPNGGNGTTGGTPVGGGAPIDGGISVLLIMGSAYAFRRAYKFKGQK